MNPALKEATEFSRRRSLAFAEVKHMNTARTSEVHVSLGGKFLGSRLEVLKRGKVVSVSYSLPPLEG